MYEYRAFGEKLSSEFELPELKPHLGPDSASWRVIRLLEPESTAGELLGIESLSDQIAARLYRTSSGFRIEVDQTGIFVLSTDGSSIAVHASPDSTPDFVRAHLLGRVLATSLHLRGIPTLHGSAVALPEGAIALCAPKFHGKSTMALALIERGGRLLTDDTLPVEIRAGRAIAWPGIHSVRLKPDSASEVGLELTDSVRADGKHVINALADETVCESPTPLRAVYLISAVEALGPCPAVTRTRLNPVVATAALMGQTKIGKALGPLGSADLLQHIARIAGVVPIYRLDVVRDFNRLAEAADCLLGWHGSAAPAHPESAPC